MRILTYKRTHTGDPNAEGQFGINDCMGRVRTWNFDAVIGIGGYGAEPKSHGIEGRVTWVGLNPTWSPHPKGYGQIVTFESFALFDQQGPMLHGLAPMLARRMYENGARVLFKSYSAQEKAEAEALIHDLLGRSSLGPTNAAQRKSAGRGERRVIAALQSNNSLQARRP